MLSIGEFSKICAVTTRTLRYYDNIDLIKPKQINKENNYRFYDVSQIRNMLLIKRLKEYNFSLEEIAEIIKTENKNYTLQKIKQKEQEIKYKIDKYKNIEKKLQFDILNLERGVDIMSFINDIEVNLIETKPQYILYSRQNMSVDDYGKYIEKLFKLAYSNKIDITAAPMSIYHDKEFSHLNNDTEVALPVKEQNQYTRLFPGGICAAAICNGDYSNLSNAYAKLTEWINENEYEIISAPYEQYVNGPIDTKSTEDFITKIYFPIRKI